jgi:hypothetical protein
VGLLKGALQLMQLVGGEGGPVPTMLFLYQIKELMALPPEFF